MLYILNKDTEVIGTLTSKGSTKATPYFDDEFLIDLATGAETFSFSTFANTPQALNIEAGNFVAFRYKGEYKLFQITETEESHADQHIKSAYCEMAGIELINEVVRPMTFNSANVKTFASRILADTGWSVGYVDSTIADVHTIEIKEHATAYSLIQSHIVGTFGAEISFTVEIQGGHVVGRLLNIYKERGDFDGFRYEHGTNVSNVVKSVDTSELVTALIGVGKDGLTFKEASASDKPLNQDFLADEEAFHQWGKNGSHIMGIYKNTSATSPVELLTLTRRELERRKTPKISYSLAVALVDESLSIGDTVYVVDNEYTPALHLSARVSKLKVSFTDKDKNECQFSNFKEVKSNITDDMRLIASIIDERFPVGTNDIQNGAVNGDKLQDGAVNRPQLILKDTIITEHLQAESIVAEKIKADQIQTQHLTAQAITAEKIDAAAIQTEHLTADLIESDHIKAEQIDAFHIKAGAIETDHIQAGQIVSAHIIAGAIDADHLKAGSVTTDALQAGSVNADKLHAGAVTADKLAADSVTTEKLQAGAVSADKLQAGSVSTDKLQADSVSAEKLQAGAVQAEHIGAKQIEAGHIKADSISSSHLAADSVTANQIASGSVQAEHIQAGQIKAQHLAAEELITDKAQIGTGVIQSAHIGEAQITTAHIGNGQITAAQILDGTISSAEIAKAAITNAHIQDATIEGAKIKELDASKIRTGTLNSGLVEVSGTNGKLKIKDNRLQVFDASETPVERVSVGDVNGDGTAYGLRVRGADGTTILYDENGVYNEGITDGAITNPKINDNSIDSRTLNLEELFVSDSAFINELSAVEINADQITTGKISSERLDISGLVGFEALNQELSESFVATDDKTFINGANILTGSVTAEQLNVKGLTVTDSNNAPTFTIDNEGEVSISGQVISSNFSDTVGEEAGYRITKDGNAVFNDAILRGDVITGNAGISNFGTHLNPNLLPHSDFKEEGVSEYYRLYKEIGDGFQMVFQDGYCRVYADDLTTAQGNNGLLTPVLTEPLVSGETYTISFDAMSHSNLSTIDYFYLITNNGTNVSLGSIAINNYNDGFGRVSKTFTASQDIESPQFLIGFRDEIVEGNTNNKGFRVKNIKVERGAVATPYLPAETGKLVRFWAGASHEDREDAPFIVYQDGKIKATQGEFKGTFTGSLSVGNIHLEDTNETAASFKINTNNDAQTVIELTDSEANLNTDISLAGFMSAKKNSNVFTVNGRIDLKGSTKARLSLNHYTGADYQLWGCTHEEGNSFHKAYYKSGTSGLSFYASGDSTVTGKTYESDFTFTRANENAQVRVEGELSVTKTIRMHENNKIKMVSLEYSGNSGIDFMLM